MEPVQTMDQLDELILQAKVKQDLEWQAFQQMVFLRLKPLNMVKASIKELSVEVNLKDKIVSSILGLSAGYLSKKLVVGDSDNKVKNLLGALLQTEVTNSVRNEVKLIHIARTWISAYLTKKQHAKE